MKIYRAWFMTAGRWDTTIGYFWTREDAESTLPQPRGAADGEVGVDEIYMPPKVEADKDQPTDV